MSRRRVISSGARMRWRDENSSEGCKHKSRRRKQAVKIINHYVAIPIPFT